MSRCSLSARRSKLARRSQALRELAHSFAQTAPVLASARFVGQKTCVGSVERSLREIPARATRPSARPKRGGASRVERLCGVSQASLENVELLTTIGRGWGSPAVFQGDVGSDTFSRAPQRSSNTRCSSARRRGGERAARD